MTCGRRWELEAIDEGRYGEADVEAFERHARACKECYRGLAERRRLDALVRELPLPGPSDLELRRLRGRVLEGALRASRPRARLAALAALPVAAAMALLVVFAVLSRSRPSLGVVPPLGPPGQAFAGDVRPLPTAVFEQTRSAGVERVALTDGTVLLHVRRQLAGERFLVIVPDGEVEVRGTTFDVAVHDGVTTRVHVDEGVVDVRIHGETTLRSGEAWPSVVASLPAPTAALEPLVAPVPRDSVVGARVVAAGRRPRAVDPERTTVSASAELAEYQRAVDAYRLGRYEAAAVQLHVFATDHPSSSVLDDALFIEAASLARLGRVEDAGALAERHLERFPASFHKRDAALLVARARRARGDCAGVERVLAPFRGERPDLLVESARASCSE